jgi:hypothetical protein
MEREERFNLICYELWNTTFSSTKFIEGTENFLLYYFHHLLLLLLLLIFLQLLLFFSTDDKLLVTK